MLYTIINKIILFLNFFIEYNTTKMITVGNNRYIDFTYNLYNKAYIQRIKITNDPIFLRNLCIKDDNDNDITEKILMYAGPNMDFNGLNLCPKDFGYSKIDLYEDGIFITSFDSNNIIKL